MGTVFGTCQYAYAARRCEYFSFSKMDEGNEISLDELIKTFKMVLGHMEADEDIEEVVRAVGIVESRTVHADEFMKHVSTEVYNLETRT